MLFHRVYVAKDGAEGLALYEEYYEEHYEFIDIVLTDISMPVMNGIKMGKEIYKLNPEQKILILSAHDDKKYLLELIDMGISGFLQKPLKTKEIKSTLFKVCKEIQEEKKLLHTHKLKDGFLWDAAKMLLLDAHKESIKLSLSEKALLHLLFLHKGESFTALELFEYLHPEEEFSINAIKSLIKRLRKKLPPETIVTIPHKGYTISDT